MVQTGSLLKCPHPVCNFCALSVPEIQAHLGQCPLRAGTTDPSAPGGGGEQLVHVSVDVKPAALLKREPLPSVKQEAVDPLKQEVSPPADDGDGDAASDGVLAVSVTSEKQECSWPRCSFATSSRSSFRAHMIMHQRKDVLKDVKKTCPVCKLSFKTLFKFKEHLSKHASKMVGGKVKCLVADCGQAVNKSGLYEHIIFGHFGDQYKLRCDQCDFRTTTSSKLKSHLMMHMDERPFKCQECDKGFRNNRQLQDHLNIVHKKEPVITCTECCVSFLTQFQLNKHKQSKHSNLIFNCQSCDKTFTSNASLKAHVKNVHRKTRDRTVCCVCGSMQGSCDCEEQERMSNNSSDKASCPVCKKEMLARNLASHLHYHRQSSLRPYICQQCSQTFTHASSLKRHALLHTGLKQYKCQQCGKEFFQKVAYETHCRSHTGQRLHCATCHQPFLTQYLLNFHLKSKPECRKSA